jgi:hypothetical protein
MNKGLFTVKLALICQLLLNSKQALTSFSVCEPGEKFHTAAAVMDLKVLL